MNTKILACPERIEKPHNYLTVREKEDKSILFVIPYPGIVQINNFLERQELVNYVLKSTIGAGIRFNRDLSKVVAYLLENNKHSFADVHVQITAHKKGLSIHSWDKGIGFKAPIEHCFEFGYSTAIRKSLGLGLYTLRAVLQQYDSYISVSSKNRYFSQSYSISTNSLKKGKDLKKFKETSKKIFSEVESSSEGTVISIWVTKNRLRWASVL